MQLHVWACFQCFGMSSIALGGRWKYTVSSITYTSAEHLSSHEKGFTFFKLPQSFVDPIFSSLAVTNWIMHTHIISNSSISHCIWILSYRKHTHAQTGKHAALCVKYTRRLKCRASFVTSHSDTSWCWWIKECVYWTVSLSGEWAHGWQSGI